MRNYVEIILFFVYIIEEKLQSLFSHYSTTSSPISPTKTMWCKEIIHHNSQQVGCDLKKHI